ncbi:hypothetical protein AK830_g9474 [Neonectria ditissima]|uniref:Uncharacterized protein n=1 Tax=Neonectria ditissima TaxID=78410 RepID=A0A0P7ARV8_9HYPO|nr:hypothetical protein AK830_g9474 [Neonectria ditissima]
MTVADAHGAEAPWTSWLPLCCMPLTSSEKTTSERRSGCKSSLTTTSTTYDLSWPLGSLSDDQLLMGQDEKHPSDATIIYNQPVHYLRPVAAPEMGSHHRNVLEKTPRGSGNKQGESKRRRLMSFSSSSSSRRPIISAPSNFRHISTAAPDFPEPTPSRNSNLRPAKPFRRRSFRPLELSIYMPNNNPSPILPHFEFPSAPAPAALYDREPTEKSSESDFTLPKTPDQSEKRTVKELGSPFTPIRSVKRPEDHATPRTPDQVERVSENSSADRRLLEHQRSFSSMSFHFPRKQTMDSSSPSTIHEDEMPPLIPPKARARSRAYTAPDVDAIKERVAGAIIEVEKLQKQIDDVIERQSLYSVSRPSTSHSMAHTMPGEDFTDLPSPVARLLTSRLDLESMPAMPALPPAAPSFAERLNSEIDRPHTAPIKPHTNAHRRAKTAGDAPTGPHTPSPPRVRREERPLAPPLPLVLRPPLRKKKSFSRVSNWLFPGAEPNGDLTFDSVTNLPRPVTGKDGYYQCVSRGEAQGRRQSTESFGTITTWESEDDRTFPSTWSPDSTPMGKGDEFLIPRAATFGRADLYPRRTSVGVAV